MSKAPGVIALAAVALLVAACNADKSSTPTTESQVPTATEPIATGGTPTVITLEPPLVSQVIDGDTIDLDSGDRIRLVQIDAPERKGECYGGGQGTSTAPASRDGGSDPPRPQARQHRPLHRILEDCQCFLEDGRWGCDSLGTRTE